MMSGSRMGSVSVQSVQSHLDRLLKYLHPHLMFVNCHMVGFLTDQLWHTYIPDDVRNSIKDVGDVDEAIELFWNYHRDPDGCAESNQPLLKYLQNSRQHRLHPAGGIAITVEQLNDHLRSLGFKLEDGNGWQIKEFMSEKKNHEVEVTAQVVATLCGSSNMDQKEKLSVIDAGDGKGYLSSRLALEHRLDVLGIDAKAGNTAGAQKRTAQLEVSSRVLLLFVISFIYV